MPLMRFETWPLWTGGWVGAGAVSNMVPVYNVQTLLVYVKVSAATSITLQVWINKEWVDYDTKNFTGAGYAFWIFECLPVYYIRFKNSTGCYITLVVCTKT